MSSFSRIWGDEPLIVKSQTCRFWPSQYGALKEGQRLTSAVSSVSHNGSYIGQPGQSSFRTMR